MKKLNRIGIYFALILTGAVAMATPAERLSVLADVTFASEYVIDGFNVGDHSPVTEMTLKMNLPKTEFSLMYWNALQLDREKKADDEHDLFILYRHDFLSESRFAFNFHGFYDYWFYPNTLEAKDGFGDPISAIERHGSKVHSGVSLTQLIPLAGSFLVPSYNVYYWLYWANDRKDLYQGGTRHELLLDYSHWIPRWFKGSQSQYVGASTSLNYIDKAFNVHSGWSHTTASLYSGVKAFDISFSLSLNQQWSLEESVNPTNEFWTAVSLTKEL